MNVARLAHTSDLVLRHGKSPFDLNALTVDTH
jgi:hypothetical protein